MVSIIFMIGWAGMIITGLTLHDSSFIAGGCVLGVMSIAELVKIGTK